MARARRARAPGRRDAQDARGPGLRRAIARRPPQVRSAPDPPRRPSARRRSRGVAGLRGRRGAGAGRVRAAATDAAPPGSRAGAVRKQRRARARGGSLPGRGGTETRGGGPAGWGAGGTEMGGAEARRGGATETQDGEGAGGAGGSRGHAARAGVGTVALRNTRARAAWPGTRPGPRSRVGPARGLHTQVLRRLGVRPRAPGRRPRGRAGGELFSHTERARATLRHPCSRSGRPRLVRSAPGTGGLSPPPPRSPPRHLAPLRRWQPSRAGGGAAAGVWGPSPSPCRGNPEDSRGAEI